MVNLRYNTKISFVGEEDLISYITKLKMVLQGANIVIKCTVKSLYYKNEFIMSQSIFSKCMRQNMIRQEKYFKFLNYLDQQYFITKMKNYNKYEFSLSALLIIKNNLL